MKSLFIQIQLLTETKEQQGELINFLKNYSGQIDLSSLIALPIKQTARIK